MHKISLGVLAVLTAALSVLLSTCKDAGEPVQLEEGGPGIIIPGVGMEGVKLGDSQESVIARLGSQVSFGFADGVYRSWRLLSYSDGPHAGLSFYFLEEEGGAFGPLDGVGAESLNGIQYTGKTKEGIGIGASVLQVHRAYGQPDTSLYPVQWWITEYYCLGGREFIVQYQDSQVVTLFIGHFKPIPEDPMDPCK